MHAHTHLCTHTHTQRIATAYECTECEKKFTFYRRQVCSCGNHALSAACIIIIRLAYSITAVGVWLQCVITAQNTRYPFLTYHPSLKESVISALMSSQLDAKMKVRIFVVGPIL